MTQRNPPGVMLYFDMIDSLQCLSAEEQGELFLAILRYAQSGTQPQLSPASRVLWGLIRARIDRDTAHYYQVVENRRLAAQKRWSKARGDANAYI